MNKPAMNWIDMETTGLSAQDEVPLEVAWCITDKDGNILAENMWLIHDDDGYYSERIYRAMEHPIVGAMHDASGLWDLLSQRELTVYASRALADIQMASWIEANGGAGLPLAGSSIGSLDRPFLQEHFPGTNAVIHYRNIDNSSIKELCRMHNPEVYAKVPASEALHRAIDDIKASIEEYKFYLNNFLRIKE